MRILRNYILKETLGPFLFALLVFTFVMLMGNLIKLTNLVIAKGVSIFAVGKMFVYMIPYLLGYTLPMATVTATLLAFGRLSADNEIVAMRASGISCYRIGLPLIVLGLIASLFSVPLNDKILTYTHFASRKAVKQIGLKNPAAYLEAGTFIRHFSNYIIFIYDIDGNVLNNIRIYQPQEGRPTRTIIADKGIFIPYPQKNLVKLKLMNGSSDEPNPDDPNTFYKLNFKTYYLNLELGESGAGGKIDKKVKEMTIRELRQRINELNVRDNKSVSPLLTEIHKKLSMAFAPLALVFVGIPLGMHIRRREKSANFGLGLVLILGYYVLYTLGQVLSLKGILPGLSVWLPNAVMVFVGIIATRFFIER
jgi:lipopolysaccharide export system permease protein